MCFAAVRLLGTDRIGHWEHVVVERFWVVAEMVVPNVRGQEGQARVEEGVEGVGEAVEGVYADVDAKSGEVGVAGIDHGVKEAEQRNKAEASELFLWDWEAEMSEEMMETNALAASRYLDAAGVGVRDTQELHLHPGAVDGGVDAEGSPRAEGMGLGYREEKAQGGQRYKELSFYVRLRSSRRVCTV